MSKSLNLKLAIFIVAALGFTGCKDWDPINGFDEGHTQREFEDEKVGFYPISQEASEADESVTLEVQLIAEPKESDVEVGYSISDGSTAEEGEHFEIVSDSPVSIEAGTNTADVEIELIEGSVEEEVSLQFSLDEVSDGVEPADNLKEAEIFISPAN